MIKNVIWSSVSDISGDDSVHVAPLIYVAISWLDIAARYSSRMAAYRKLAHKIKKSAGLQNFTNSEPIVRVLVTTEK